MTRYPQGQDWPTTQITLLRKIADQCDSDAWPCFVQTYAPLIRRYCMLRGMQEADAHDVAQEVLMQVSKGIQAFHYDSQRGRFRSWLGTVTHRAMLKYLARKRRPGAGAGNVSANHDPLGSQASQQPVDAEWESEFNSHVYRVAVARLRLSFSAETWLAFERTFVEERAPEHVARELQRSVGWVYQAKSKVVRQLRDEILFLAEDSVWNLLADKTPNAS